MLAALLPLLVPLGARLLRRLCGGALLLARLGLRTRFLARLRLRPRFLTCLRLWTWLLTRLRLRTWLLAYLRLAEFTPLGLHPFPFCTPLCKRRCLHLCLSLYLRALLHLRAPRLRLRLELRPCSRLRLELRRLPVCAALELRAREALPYVGLAVVHAAAVLRVMLPAAARDETAARVRRRAIVVAVGVGHAHVALAPVEVAEEEAHRQAHRTAPPECVGRARPHVAGPRRPVHGPVGRPPPGAVDLQRIVVGDVEVIR